MKSEDNMSMKFFMTAVDLVLSVTSASNGVEIDTAFVMHTNSTLSVRGSQETSASDVCRRQIMLYKVDPRTERVNICMMAVDP